MEKWTVKNTQQMEQFIAHVRELQSKHKEITFEWTTDSTRTLTQNNALHLFLGKLAKALNDAGLDMRKVIKPGVDIPWTMVSAKDHLWRPIQKAMFGKESSAIATKAEYRQVYDTLNRHLSEKFGISVEWPNND